MRRATKKEKGRNDRKLMKSAIKAIAEFFGMERATKREILATFTEAGEHLPNGAREL